MVVFKGNLYIGNGLPRQGKGGTDTYGPFPGELIRLYPDDNWDLVIGTQRFTPHGLKRPLSGMGPGFSNLFTNALWRMTEHNGWLYIGTSDWRFLPTYLPPLALHPRNDLSHAQLRFLRKHTSEYQGGFGFWRSQDGITWIPITTTGFDDNPYNYGIRELASTPYGLFVAPVSSTSSQEGGGLEIWLGSEGWHHTGEIVRSISK
jgi:hypothetical protein